MSSLRLKRKLKVKDLDDYSSEYRESCTSGSSYKPSDSEAEADSTVDFFDSNSNSENDSEVLKLSKLTPTVRIEKTNVVNKEQVARPVDAD